MIRVFRGGLIAFASMLLAACAQVPLPSSPIPSPPAAIEPDEIVYLWPGEPPGGIPEGLKEKTVERDNPFGLPDRAAHDVTAPSLSVFHPAHPDGSAILIIPGGGYKWVVIDKEGYEGAVRFSGEGATVYVLRYRLPHQNWQAGPQAPLQDAQRAVRVIRSREGQDGIDPDRLLVMGFSAGGHLAGLLETGSGQVTYAPVDAADYLSARPDATVLMYPVVTMRPPFAHAGSRLNQIGGSPTSDLEAEWSIESRAAPGQPPVFILHAADDKAVPVENAIMAYEAFRKAGVPVSLHLFETGGHGFGLRGIAGTPLEVWPDLVRDWGQAEGVFPGSPGN
jgi:acetyl esterase/lipase